MPVTLGRGSYIHKKSYTNTFDGIVTIGKYSSIAKGVTFLTGPGVNHSTIINKKRVTNYQFGKRISGGTIIIKDDVWIGTNVTIVATRDIVIGEGAIIGAECVVTKNVPPYAIVVGNPMVVKGFRFSSEIIEKLLKIQWWDWPYKLIKKRKPDFEDIDEFVRKYYPKTS